MANPVKRVAAVHDLSGYGRASLTVVIPVLATMGIKVCPLPTAVLSTNSKFAGYHFIDLTDHLLSIIKHWKELGAEFDAIYSGFLGSARQIDIVKGFIEDFKRPGQLVLVDPVLGDEGKLYGPLDSSMVKKMRELIGRADIITPNLTEAALLLDCDYDPTIEMPRLKEWVLELARKGPKVVIVTSVSLKGKKDKTSVVAYNSEDKRMWKVSCDYFPAEYPGTGDTFASIIVGCLLQGDSLPIALDRAVQFISLGVRSTFGYDYDCREGIVLERILQTLHAPVQIGSYEVF